MQTPAVEAVKDEPLQDSPASSESPPEVGGPYAYYVLGVLFVVYIFNFIDRQILAILLEPIKQDLQISDTALGFLTGFAFAIFYTVAGIPLARLADRWVRREPDCYQRGGLESDDCRLRFGPRFYWSRFRPDWRRHR